MRSVMAIGGVLLMALSACGTNDAVIDTPFGTPPPSQAVAADACGAAGYQSLVGGPLAAITLPASADIRVLRPGDIVTQDYRATRLNMHLDENGVVLRLACG